MKKTFSRFEAEPSEPMLPSNFTAPETFTTEDRHESNHFYFADEGEGVLAGVWESAPCREVIDPYPVNEMMTVVAGRVTLTSLDDNRSETYTAGDTFFVARGTRCIWEITETLRKYYFIAP